MGSRSIKMAAFIMFVMAGSVFLNGLGIFEHNPITPDTSIYSSYTTTNLTEFRPNSDSNPISDSFGILSWLIKSATMFFGMVVGAVTFLPEMLDAFGVPPELSTMVIIGTVIWAMYDLIMFMAPSRLEGFKE